MNNHCKIVEDLLPLYIEGLTNEENTKLIDEHISSCNNCRDMLNNIKEDIPFESTKINSENIEDKAMLVAKNISKYQNILKLSLCFVTLLFMVVISSIPVAFVNTLAPLVLVPFICRFIYNRNLPLILLSGVCAVVGGGIITGSILDGWTVAIGLLILMTIGIFAGDIYIKSRNSKGKKEKKILLTVISFLILGAGIYTNSAFNGTPFGYFNTHYKISNYIREAYKDEDIKIKGVFYNWKDGYYADVSKDSENFTINLYKTGYIQDNYTLSRINSFNDSYAKTIEVALKTKFNNQHFRVVASNSKGLESLSSPQDMDLIIRFTDSNAKYSKLSQMSRSNFIDNSNKVVDILDNLDLSYNNINFQAVDENDVEMYLDLNKGLKLDNIY